MAGAYDYDVFLSYSSPDHIQAEALGQRLRSAGLRVFLDRWYLTPGTHWPAALEKTLQRCRAVAVCIGATLGPWQQREQYSALLRQSTEPTFPVIPVLLPGGTLSTGFLTQNTWVDLSTAPDHPLQLERLVKAIRGEPPGPELAQSVQRVRAQLCPYRGLRYFDEADADVFFGRSAATQQIERMVTEFALVAVVGASGSGKSSVVRAGLLPRLRASTSHLWEIATLVPTDRPLHALSAALLPLLAPESSEVTRLAEIGQLAQQLENGVIALRDVVERILAKQPGTERLLLVVDQWEELFTLADDEGTRRCFIENVLEATEKSRLSVVLTLRGDFFGRAITGQRALSDRLQGAVVNLGPMTEAELREAIEQPAERVCLTFEPGLIDTLLADAGDEPGNLPLLEFVLRELWEQRQGNLLHRAAYEAMGKLQGAIARKAEALYERLVTQDPRAAHTLQALFLRLVRPGEGQQDTRRRAALSEFGPAAAVLIQRLSEERLLVGSASSLDQAEMIEVAHETLIQHWQRLREWVAQDRQFLTWQQTLGAEANRWQDRQRRRDLLLRGLPLSEAVVWHRQRRDDLSVLECEFIAAGSRQRWRVRGLAAGVGVMVLATVGYFFAQAVESGNRARLARERAEELVEFMVFDLRDKLKPMGRLDLMTGINARVSEYYDKLGDGESPVFEHSRIANYTNEGNTLLQLGKLEAARRAFEQALAIAQRLAKADPTNAAWQRDLSLSYDKLGELEVAAGKLEAARRTIEQSLTISERLAKADPTNIDWQRNLSISYDKLGDLEVAAGKLEAARQTFEQSLTIHERLAKTDPTNTAWQRDLSVSYDRLGDLEVATGKLGAARRTFERSLRIRERLAKADPTNTAWQRDLVVSYIKLGDLEVAAGKLEAARRTFEQSLTITERLARADPTNTDWQRDLSVSYDKLGELEVAAGKLEAARRTFEQSLTIRERLAKADPTNTVWQRDLFVSYIKLGDLEVAAGKLEAARHTFEQSLTIAERLAKTDPTNTDWQRDLSVSYIKLGDIEVAAGKLEAARRTFERSLTIRERLAKADPTNTAWQRDLAVSYVKFGILAAKQNQPSEAWKFLERGRVISQRLTRLDPSNAVWKRDLEVFEANIARLRN